MRDANLREVEGITYNLPVDSHSNTPPSSQPLDRDDWENEIADTSCQIEFALQGGWRGPPLPQQLPAPSSTSIRAALSKSSNINRKVVIFASYGIKHNHLKWNWHIVTVWIHQGHTWVTQCGGGRCRHMQGGGRSGCAADSPCVKQSDLRAGTSCCSCTLGHRIAMWAASTHQAVC